MGINLSQLNLYVVQPVLTAFGIPWNSEAAVILLLGTAIHKSASG